mmetsp:Transcript_7045/g.10363  ORF Transcript_7045/g.10363 Transcript_7045/m.10363 type:complete len:788 (-) Transcript_7045:32-2395(-)
MDTSNDSSLYSFQETPSNEYYGNDFGSMNSGKQSQGSMGDFGSTGDAQNNFFAPAVETGVAEEYTSRPMTSIGAVGYRSEENKLNELPGGASTAPPLKKRSENSPAQMALEIEGEINVLIEKSAIACAKKDFTTALDHAKSAEKKERHLIRYREQKDLKEQNIDLTYAVQFNLARCYDANGMHTEALDTYTGLVKNKNYNQSGRLRINIGNLFFEQKKYLHAIKHYRMAVDQIMPAHHNNIRNKIRKNIGTAFVRLGQYNDAVNSFEQIVENTNNDVQVAFNLLLCYYALGDKSLMCKGFRILLNVQIPGLVKDDELESESKNVTHNRLRDYLMDKQRKHYDCIFKGAQLIAEVIESDWERGYDWVIEQLRSFCLKHEKCNLAAELEMAKALNYLKHKKFQEAIKALTAFEKKDKKLQARAATNLSYLYLLKNDIPNAEKYAKLSVEHDKYNAKALVNMGNVMFMKKNYAEAKNVFQEAILAEPDNIQAIYNMGLVSKKMKHLKEALQTFKRLYAIIPESIEVLFQIASCYQELGDHDRSIEWFNRLITRVPTDPTALYNLGTVYGIESDEAQSLNFYLESYRYYPINIRVISWLGLYFVKHEMYEKALSYFQRASQIQPEEVNWKIMVASSYRRIGKLTQAKKCYEDILLKYPEHKEGLEYLVQICHDLGLSKEEKDYKEKLEKLKLKQARQQGRSKNNLAPPNQDDDFLARQAAQFVPVGIHSPQQVAVQQDRQDTPQTPPNNAMRTPNSPVANVNVNDRLVQREDDDLLATLDSGDDLLMELGI